MRTVPFRCGLLVLVALGVPFPAGSQTEPPSKPQTRPAQQAVAAPKLPPPPASATYRIDPGKAERDAHLRTPDFFAVEQFPKLTFVSTQVTVQDRSIRILGDLTIRGRTRPVLLVGTYQGRFPDPWGQTRVAYLASTTIDRHDFGVSYDGPFLDVGQIGDEVWIEIAIEAVQQP